MADPVIIGPNSIGVSSITPGGLESLPLIMMAGDNELRISIM